MRTRGIRTIMTELIVGKPDSGKSAFAEEKALEKKTFPDAGNIYYIATMQVVDEDSKERVKKHRKMREGKGFITIEKETDILSAVNEMEGAGDATVLLECISNLVGNEMHRPGVSGELTVPADKIAADVKTLSEKVKYLIIVTNEFDNDESFDDDTKDYIKLVSLVNERLRAFSEVVYELA